MPPPVQSKKNDAQMPKQSREAAKRAPMRFVTLKPAEQQSALMMYRARDLLVRQRARACQCVACSGGGLIRRAAPLVRVRE
jgi:transposase